MTSNYNIAILLTCHNRKEKTLMCLEHLFACELPNNCRLNTYLVDDGSIDGTSDSIKEKFPQVKIIQGNGQLYWNRGMNLAWKTATKENDYDFYLWLNDDTNLYPNALIELLESSESKNNESIICGSTCAVGDNKEITYSGYKNIVDVAILFLVPNGNVQECICFNGNIVLIPIYVFKKISFNDIYFWHSFGDIDYGLRANKIGIKSFISPNVLGECDRHDSLLPVWDNIKFPIFTRWKHLHSPLGANPREQFYFNKRHFGLLKATLRYISIYGKFLFPRLWEKIIKLWKWLKSRF